MEKLRYGGLASLKTDVGKNVKSFPTKHLFTTLLLMLLCMMPQKGWAQAYDATETYDFNAYAAAGGTITMSSTSYSSVANTNIADKMTASGLADKDISRFAFRTNSEHNRGWFLRTDGNQALHCTGTKYTAEFAILNLRAGDRVKITYLGEQLIYKEGVNLLINTTYGSGKLNANDVLTSAQEMIILQDGDLILSTNKETSGPDITKIEIRPIRNAKYSITSTTTSSGTPEHTFAFTSNGRMNESTVVVPFMLVEFGSDLNAPIVNGLKVTIPDESGYEFLWPQNGKPYQGSFYVFKPTASGKLWIKGNMSNAQMQLLDYDENGTYQSALWTGSASGDVEIGWINVKKNHVYYLVEGYDQLSDNNRQRTVFRLEQFKFQNTFSMGSLGAVLTNGAKSGTLATVKNGGIFKSWKVRNKYGSTTEYKVSDNIDTRNLSVDCSSTGELTISGIGYKDSSKDQAGVIVLDLEFENGDATFVVTIPYSASFNNGEGHKWDFSSNVLEIGQYKTAGSQLQQETDNGEWKQTWRVINNQGVGTHDPMFQNVYDMEGDNADMIWETEGLWFETPTYKSCLYNENDAVANSSTDPDRYVGILPGGSFTIPALNAGDRVCIYMGSGDGSSDDACKLNITGALDAVGNSISSSDIYNAGGSQWLYGGGVYQYRGAYQFISTGGDMTFTMNGGSMVKLYTIEIYQGTKKYSVDAARANAPITYNGEVYQNAYQINNEWRNEAGRAVITLHYRGKGQRLNPTVLYTSGSIDTDETHLFYAEIGTSKAPYIFLKSEKEKGGMFRMRIEDKELNNKYVADYALQNMTVGYLNKKNYPYTWDFTDLADYAASNIAVEQTKVANYAPKTVNGGYDIEFMNNSVGEGVKAVEQWKYYEANGDIPAGYGMHVRNEPYSGGLMWGAGQLYAGNGAFDESFGLSITAPGNHERHNGGLRITDKGLSLTGGNWKIMIPLVGSDAVASVYVRAAKIGNSNIVAGVGSADTPFTHVGEATDGSGDMIYAVTGTGSDMSLFFRNHIIKKIAVSQDTKTVNKLGYATESRNVLIDPELMGYMTGTGLKAYTVTNVSYGTKPGDKASVTLTQIPSDKILEKSITGDHNAYIIYNTDDAANGTKAVSILDGGFHLFVPDMHDEPGSAGKKSYLDITNNALVSMINGGAVPQESGAYTNYLMNYKYTSADGKSHEGPEAFYRASKSASLGANKAYLQLLTANVKPTEANQNGAKFAIVFVDEEANTETTALDGVKSVETMGDNAIYTLSGVKVSKPEKGGIYVKNGKKFIVK